MLSLVSTASFLQCRVRLGYQNQCLHALKCLCFSCTVMSAEWVFIDGLRRIGRKPVKQEKSSNNTRQKNIRREELQEQALEHHCSIYTQSNMTYNSGCYFVCVTRQVSALSHNSNHHQLFEIHCKYLIFSQKRNLVMNNVCLTGFAAHRHPAVLHKHKPWRLHRVYQVSHIRFRVFFNSLPCLQMAVFHVWIFARSPVICSKSDASNAVKMSQILQIWWISLSI